MKKIKAMIWHRIKRYLSKRRKSELRKAISGLKENQSKIVDIANYLMSHKGSKLVYSAISGTFFIEHKDVICRIESDRVIITNGLYSYDISIPIVITLDLTKRFLNHSCHQINCGCFTSSFFIKLFFLNHIIYYILVN